MTIPTITPPAQVSQEFGWNAMKDIKRFLEDGKGQLVPGFNARQARLLFAQLERYMTNLNNQITGGLLDGDTTWKTAAQSMLAELNNIANIGRPIEKKYSEQTGNLISSSAAAGTVLSLEQASAQVVFEQTDIDSLVAVINSALGV